MIAREGDLTMRRRGLPTSWSVGHRPGVWRSRFQSFRRLIQIKLQPAFLRVYLLNMSRLIRSCRSRTMMKTIISTFALALFLTSAASAGAHTVWPGMATIDTSGMSFIAIRPVFRSGSVSVPW